ncbi:MAG: helix-turn-helix domain-containing protein [Actinobacteria bacterium]|nr:helix-turn-helix domain-containing protein [Actinomycetota bacterium]
MSQAAAIVRDARQQAGLSLRELARRAETSHATLSRYESGAVEPSFAVVERIVAACGLQMDIALSVDDDVRLERLMAKLSPTERLQTIANWDRLRGRAAS